MKKIIIYSFIMLLFFSVLIIFVSGVEAIEQHETSDGITDSEIVSDVYNVSGLYTGFRFDTSADGGSDPSGVGTDGTNIWVSEPNILDNDVVLNYTMNGTYVSNFNIGTSGNEQPYGLGTDGSYIWVSDDADDEIYKYTMNGTYISSFDTATSGNTEPFGVGTDGNYIWVSDYVDVEIYKYNMSGVYVSSFDTFISGNTVPYGVGTDGSYIWVSDDADDEIYKYTMNGTYISSFDTATSGNTEPFGVGVNETNIWVSDPNDNAIYKYDKIPTFNITRGIVGLLETNKVLSFSPTINCTGNTTLKIAVSTSVKGIVNVINNTGGSVATEVNTSDELVNNTFWYDSANQFVHVKTINITTDTIVNWTVNCSYGATFAIQVPQYLEVGDYFMASGLIKDNDSVPIDGFVAETRILYQNGTDAIDPYHEWNCTNGNYWCVISTTSLPPGIYDISIEFTDASSGITFKEGSTLYLSWSPASGIYSDAVVFFNFYNTNEGLGLPRETLKIYVDNARQYDNSYYTYISDVINVTIKDYYNTTLYTNNFTISEAYTFLDLGLTFHSYKFCNKNEEYYMISLLKSGASRWWERGVCPYETIEYLIPSGTYTLRIYDADTVEIYNDSVSVVNSLVYVIEGTNLSEIISGQSIITGQLLELSTEIDYALMPDAYYYMANPTIIFSCFDSVGQKLGQNVWKVCPAKQLIATTRNETYSNWINSTALVPGNGSVANGTITIDEDILYLSGNGTISWVNITYTSNGTLMQNTTYIPNLIHLSGQDLTINASENINVQRETRFNQVKKFYWDIYNSSDNTGYLANRPGYHVATLEFENVLDVPLYDTYIFIGFSDKTSPDSNTVRVTDVSNDGVVLESGEDYRTSESGIDFKILGGMSASSTRTFTVEYYKEDHTEYVYDEGTIEAGYIERQKSFQDEFYNYFDFIWQNNRDKTFRGGILVKIAPSKIETEIIKGSVIIIDRDNSNQEIDDSQYVVGDTFIMISSEIVGDVTPGGGRSFGIYYQEEQYPGSNPREFHLNTPIGRFLLIMWTPFLLIVVFPLLLMAVGIYLAIREGKLKDSYKALIAVGLVVTVLFWILQAKGV